MVCIPKVHAVQGLFFMNQGYVSIHRKILDHPIANRPTYSWLWIVLLLSANFQDKKVIWEGKTITCKRGQFITSRKSLSKQTGIPEGTIEDILRWLEIQQQIQQQKNNKWRMITILKYDYYQLSDRQSNSQPTSSRHLADTTNNDNNDNNEKKDSVKSSKKNFPENINIEELQKQFPSKNIEEEIKKMKNYCQTTGRIYKDHMAFARSWLKNSYESYSSDKPIFIDLNKIGEKKPLVRYEFTKHGVYKEIIQKEEV